MQAWARARNSGPPHPSRPPRATSANVRSLNLFICTSHLFSKSCPSFAATAAEVKRVLECLLASLGVNDLLADAYPSRVAAAGALVLLELGASVGDWIARE